MKTPENLTVASHENQQFYRLYSSNAILPSIDWNNVFQLSQLDKNHIQALDAIYQSCVPLALNVFDQLKFDVFAPAAYQPQGLGLFEKLTDQEALFLSTVKNETQHLNPQVRHQIWSMLLRGAAVLVFKAWLAKVKTGLDQIDMSQFDELNELLFIQTTPLKLAAHLEVDPKSKMEHIFLLHGHDVFLDRFNSLETAALFVELGVYDAAFLSLRDDRVAEYLKSLGYVNQDQIEDLQCALNPLYCDNLSPKQNCLA